jgi:uncharacterized NAD(P)/FAD-binding protein YdhS
MQKITIFGTGTVGLGKAYGGIQPDFRLNIRDDLLNITFGDGPIFADWAAREINDSEAVTKSGRFYRRRDFGRYVEHLVTEALGQVGKIEHDQVFRLASRPENKWEIETERGVTTASRVVLATGNPNPEPRFPIPEDGVITTLWYGDWPEYITLQDEIVIIGNGLTAMDALLALNRMGHESSVHLVSPKAELPPCQAAWKHTDTITWPRIEKASEFIRFWRDHLPDQPWESSSWQENFEALRGELSATWRQMPRSARKQVALRLTGWWQPARYRAAPQTTDAASSMLKSGQLKMTAGRVSGIEKNPRNFDVVVDDGTKLPAHKVLVAIGAGRDPLVENLTAEGLLPAERIGVEVDDSQRIMNSHGLGIKGLYAIGPQTAFSRGDIVGAAGVSREALSLANHLMEETHG